VVVLPTGPLIDSQESDLTDTREVHA